MFGWADELSWWDEELDECTCSNCVEGSKLKSKESVMVGQQSTTGNYLVNKLPVGAVLQVVEPGVIEVVSLSGVEFGSEVNFEEGDRVLTSHGAGTVVRLGVSIDNEDNSVFNPETEILYVADEDSVVRRAFKSEVSAL